jgi:hypothetical protein
VFSNLRKLIGHRLTVYCMADYRGSRFDGYTQALIVILVIGIGVIYL